jgi:hypothetical protein
MKRAWRVACDSNTIMTAKAASAGADRVIDRNLFRQKMATIGLNDAELTPDGMSPHFLAEFTWTNLWNDVRKPAINSSRKLTPAEQQAFNAQVAAFQKSINDAQALVGGRLKEMQTRTDFTAAAAKYRGNRRLSRSESILLQVWLGKTEQDVVAANGNPSIRQAGARFLSYGQAFNNQVLWQNVVTGATMTGGGYDTCNVTFALIPDSAGTLLSNVTDAPPRLTFWTLFLSGIAPPVQLAALDHRVFPPPPIHVTEASWVIVPVLVPPTKV